MDIGVSENNLKTATTNFLFKQVSNYAYILIWYSCGMTLVMGFFIFILINHSVLLPIKELS